MAMIKDRDEFPRETRDILAKRVGGRCSICRVVTSGPHDKMERAVSVGVAAHISGAAPGGPRYDPAMTPQARASIGNGIWLCQIHAKLVDNDVVRYTVARLVQIKAAAEQSTRLELERGISTAQNLGDLPKISIAHLPVTGSQLFGRDAELRLLDQVWRDGFANVFSFIAWGGVGKSCLVNSWLRRMAAKGYGGAEQVYGWSFYRQGSSGGVISSDLFMHSALKWFGDPDPEEGSGWDKGVRLAALVRARRTLLVLDGMEPLQHPPGPQEGRLKDESLQALLRDLAAYNPGLCVVTTRLPLADLADFENGASLKCELEHLSTVAGAELLRWFAIQGTRAELEETSAEFGGHALALTLLASYLGDVYQGDVRHRRDIPRLADDVRFGGHARRVMASYERWFGEGPELCVLRMMGLFDKPADPDSVSALRGSPPIVGLTDGLQALDGKRWQQVLANLRRAGLLASRDAAQPDSLDAHPLIREYFRERLKQLSPLSWKEGNKRLFHHLAISAEQFPDNIEEMAPLYAAVAHGCRASLYQQALDGVYWQRILRGNEQFSWLHLGAFGADLEALSNFFLEPWEKLVDDVSPEDEGFVLGQAGMLLGKMGRLEEAAHVMKISLQKDIRRGRLANASVTAGNISNTFLILGRLGPAVQYGSNSADLADRSGDEEEMRISRTVWANALHHAGLLEESALLFQKAEALATNQRTESQTLFGAESFEYCHLLLSQGKYTEVRRRAEAILQLAEQSNTPQISLRVGLALALSFVLEFEAGGGTSLDLAEPYLLREVANLRQRREMDLLPFALTVSAMYKRLKSRLEHAEHDLDDAMSIAVRCGMGLYQMDCYVEYVRLYVARGEIDNARRRLTAAEEMIRQNGYHRRDGDVAQLRLMLG